MYIYCFAMFTCDINVFTDGVSSTSNVIETVTSATQLLNAQSSPLAFG